MEESRVLKPHKDIQEKKTECIKWFYSVEVVSQPSFKKRLLNVWK